MLKVNILAQVNNIIFPMNSVKSINNVKATEAIALILKLEPKQMILGKLLKLLYFVDLISLERTNKSLTNDIYLCQKDGLIPKHVPDLILQLQLVEIIQVSNRGMGYIYLNRDPGTKHLSILEREIIHQVYLSKQHVNPFNLLDWGYNLKFIKRHIQQSNSKAISSVDMMRSLGRERVEITPCKSIS